MSAPLPSFLNVWSAIESFSTSDEDNEEANPSPVGRQRPPAVDINPKPPIVVYMEDATRKAAT
ncbi:hypothetical protein Dimus_033383, partial [Dionaea muscipula]